MIRGNQNCYPNFRSLNSPKKSSGPRLWELLRHSLCPSAEPSTQHWISVVVPCPPPHFTPTIWLLPGDDGPRLIDIDQEAIQQWHKHVTHIRYNHHLWLGQWALHIVEVEHLIIGDKANSDCWLFCPALPAERDIVTQTCHLLHQPTLWHQDSCAELSQQPTPAPPPQPSSSTGSRSTLAPNSHLGKKSNSDLSSSQRSLTRPLLTAL